GGVEHFAAVRSGAEDEDLAEMADQVDFPIDASGGGFELHLCVHRLAPDDLAGDGLDAGEEFVAVVQDVEVAVVEERGGHVGGDLFVLADPALRGVGQGAVPAGGDGVDGVAFRCANQNRPGTVDGGGDETPVA